MNKDFIKRLINSLVSGANTAITATGRAGQDAAGWLEKNKQANQKYTPQAVQMAQQQASQPTATPTTQTASTPYPRGYSRELIAEAQRQSQIKPSPSPQRSATQPVYGTQNTQENLKVASILDNAANKFSPNDEEFKKVIHAIALDESGGNPMAVGDKGNSIGIFQNNMASGRGIGHTKENLSKAEYNIKLSVPELYRAYTSGTKKGLKGSELTAYVSRVAQRPQAGLELRAGAKYGMRVGG